MRKGVNDQSWHRQLERFGREGLQPLTCALEKLSRDIRLARTDGPSSGCARHHTPGNIGRAKMSTIRSIPTHDELRQLRRQVFHDSTTSTIRLLKYCHTINQTHGRTTPRAHNVLEVRGGLLLLQEGSGPQKATVWCQSGRYPLPHYRSCALEAGRGTRSRHRRARDLTTAS